MTRKGLLACFITLTLITPVYADVHYADSIVTSDYSIGGDTISGIPADTTANKLLYNLRRENRNCIFELLDSAGNKVGHTKLLSDSYILTAKDKTGEYERSYKLSTGSPDYVCDDFENYPLEHFLSNDKWNCNGENSGRFEIKEDAGTNVFSATTEEEDKIILHSRKKAISGQTIMSFRIKNLAPENCKLVVAIRDSSTTVINLFSLENGKIGYYTAYDTKTYKTVNNGWIDMKVVFGNSDIDFYQNGTLVYTRKNYKSETAGSTFGWSNCYARFELNRTSGQAGFLLDDFMFKNEEYIDTSTTTKSSSNFVKDDFENYIPGHFESSKWNLNGENQSGGGYFDIINDGGKVLRATLTNNGSGNDSMNLHSTTKTLSGNTEIKFKVKNSFPSGGNITISLRQSSSVLLNLISIENGQIKYYKTAKQYDTVSTDNGWVSIRIVIDSTKAIKFYQDGVLVSSVSSYNNINSSFTGPSFMVRFEVKRTGDSAGFLLDDFMFRNGKFSGATATIESVSYKNGGEYSYALMPGSNSVKAVVSGDIEKAVGVFAIRSGNLIKKIVAANASGSDKKAIEADILLDDCSGEDTVETYIWDNTSSMTAILPKTDNKYMYISDVHPKIMANASDFERIRQANDEISTALKENVIAAANDIYSNLKYTEDYKTSDYYVAYYMPDGNLLDMAQRVKSFLETLGMAYQISGNKKYANAAYAIMSRAAKWPDWCPTHFLDTAEMTTAFAIGYDWCYNAFTETQRANILNGIKTKGLDVGMAMYRGEYSLSESSWTRSNINWNVVCNSGLIMGALAVSESYPAVSNRIISNSIESIKTPLAEFAPDGGWLEGISYARYSMQYLIKMIQALRTAAGTDYGLADTDGLDKLAEYILTNRGPTGHANYEDASATTKVKYPEVLWLAKTYDRKDIYKNIIGEINPSGTNDGVYVLLWYYPEYNVGNAWTFSNTYIRNIEQVSMGSGNTGNCGWLTIHGGWNSTDHNHMDLGSFVYDYNGERWAMDLGADKYSLDGYFATKRYNYYRTRAEGHNTLVIGPDTSGGQKEDACAKVIQYNLQADSPYAIYDLTKAYANASSVKRGVRLINGASGFVLRDEITTSSSTEKVYWFMHTDSSVKVSGKTATLTKNGKTMYFKVYGSGVSLSYVEAKPLSAIGESVVSGYPNPSGQNANSGIGKLMIKATGSCNITVSLSATDITYTPVALANWK